VLTLVPWFSKAILKSLQANAMSFWPLAYPPTLGALRAILTRLPGVAANGIVFWALKRRKEIAGPSRLK
jgi:hypothetical protein